MKSKTCGSFFGALAVFLVCFGAKATFLPVDVKPDLQTLGLNLAPANMNEAEFKDVLSRIQNTYQSLVSSQGGNLQVSGDWKSETLNAGAQQMFGSWKVQITGGLARRPELTPDGFALIVCHELGHHLSGFAFVKADNPFGGVWAAAEGQSDYFATQVCARKIWAQDSLINANFREKATRIMKQKCDAVWTRAPEQDLCYRVLAATESMITTMATLMKKPIPQYETPDASEVAATVGTHPAVQCRLDTSMQGALCPAFFNELMIPGKKAQGGPFGLEAEREAAGNSCTAYSNYNSGLRPKCWFKAQL